MDDRSELDRMDRNLSGEAPPTLWLQLTANCSEEPVIVLERIREVMRIVVTQRSKDWPSYEWWESNLPAWFAEPAKRRSYETSMQDRTLWVLEAWVDAIKDTGWLWWSTRVGNTELEINLCAYEHPYCIEVFEYLLRAAGASDISFREPELS